MLHLPQASGMGHGIQNSKNTTCNPRFWYVVPNQNALVLGWIWAAFSWSWGSLGPSCSIWECQHSLVT